MVDVICEASVSQLSDISTLDSITFLQRTNVTRYRKCHLKKAARNQRFHPKDMSCNTPVYYGIEAATFHFEQTRRLETSVPVMLEKNIHDSLLKITWRSVCVCVCVCVCQRNQRREQNVTFLCFSCILLFPSWVIVLNNALWALTATASKSLSQ